MQGDLFDAGLSAKLRDAGICAADDHADPEWRDVALLAAYECSVVYPEFTSSDVWQRLALGSATTHEGRAMGAVMKRAQKRGWIEPTDRFVNTVRVSRHRAPVRVWKSTSREEQ